MTSLVLVHGYLGGSVQWSNLTAYLNGVDWYALDLPGFGKNNHLAPLNSISDMADFVVDFAEQYNLSKFDLLGHSMGGMIAQEVAISHGKKINNLILYSTGSIGAMPGRFESIEVSKKRILKEGAATAADRISAMWYRDLRKSKYHAACSEIAQLATSEAMLSGLDAMQNWDRQHDLQKIISKTLIVWGTEDRSYTREQVELLNHKIPNSKLEFIAEASHSIHDEKPAELAEILQKFLNGTLEMN